MRRLSLGAKEWQFRAAFFIGVPLLMSLPLGLFQAGFGKFFSPLMSFLYWVSIWVCIWLVAELILRTLHRLLRPWNTPVFAEIVVSYALVVVVTAFFVPPYMEFFGRFSSEIPADSFKHRVGFAQPGYLWSLVRSGLPGWVAWTALRTFYAMLPDVKGGHLAADGDFATATLVRPEPPDRSKENTYSPFRRALEGEGVRDLRHIAALQASDHYVEVHLEDGGHLMILSRFSDAIDAMAKEDGLRVHRSFWVRRAAIIAVRREGSAVFVRLRSGLECPISAKYQGWFEHSVRSV